MRTFPEFVEWGPLNSEGRPDKAHKGEHFQAWFMTFQALGYHAEWRMLNAADYGDATTRTRFLPDGPEGRTSHPLAGGVPREGRHRHVPGPASLERSEEIIDWSNPGRSLLDDPKYLKKPLSEKTRYRIARGLERFGGPLAPLYIRLLDLPSDEPEAADRAAPQAPTQERGLLFSTAMGRTEPPDTFRRETNAHGDDERSRLLGGTSSGTVRASAPPGLQHGQAMNRSQR